MTRDLREGFEVLFAVTKKDVCKEKGEGVH